MSKTRVRCTQCGAKNAESLEERCRLCGFLLPDFHRRRLAAAGAADGTSFAESVEEEVGVWKNYGSNGTPKRTRRIFDDPSEAGNSPLTVVVALVVAAIIVLGAAQLLIT
jgi:hypothetical protein